MNQRLIAARTTFIATIGQTSMRALKTVRMAQAIGVEDAQAQDAGLEQREDEQRGPEPAERVEPAHASSHRTVTEVVTAWVPPSTGIDPAKASADRAIIGRGRWSSTPALADGEDRAERGAGERGVLGGPGPRVGERRLARRLDGGRAVLGAHLDPVDGERVAGRPGEGLEERADPGRVADREVEGLVCRVADDRLARAGRGAGGCRRRRSGGRAPRRRGRRRPGGPPRCGTTPGRGRPPRRAASHCTRARTMTRSGTTWCAPWPVTSTWSLMGATVGARPPQAGRLTANSRVAG